MPGLMLESIACASHFSLPSLFFFMCQTGHGLQKYPSTRHRIAVTLKNLAGETKYVLFATKGLPRPDGKINSTYSLHNQSSWIRSARS